MNDNAKKWVKALRSGKFKQGTNRLTTVWEDGTESDCCLGVACKLFVEENPGVLEVHITRGVLPIRIAYDSERFALPPKVMKWLGMETDVGKFDAGESLAYKNDMGHTFEGIADLIEAKQDDLFVKEVK